MQTVSSVNLSAWPKGKHITSDMTGCSCAKVEKAKICCEMLASNKEMILHSFIEKGAESSAMARVLRVLEVGSGTRHCRRNKTVDRATGRKGLAKCFGLASGGGKAAEETCREQRLRQECTR